MSQNIAFATKLGPSPVKFSTAFPFFVDKPAQTSLPYSYGSFVNFAK